MGKTVGKITVVEVAQCYGIQLELPEEVYPYLLQVMRFNNPEAFQEALMQVQIGKIEKGKIIKSDKSYYIQKDAIK